jgi:hypothetical protein
LTLAAQLAGVTVAVYLLSNPAPPANGLRAGFRDERPDPTVKPKEKPGGVTVVPYRPIAEGAGRTAA